MIITALEKFQDKSEPCGYTRCLVASPKKLGWYLVKVSIEDIYPYQVIHFDGLFWWFNGKRLDQFSVICWRELPKTEIETPF
jgi:hypothetical protein